MVDGATMRDAGEACAPERRDAALELERLRYVDLATARRQRAPHRMAMYAVAFVIGVVWVSVFWSLVCIALVATAEFLEQRAARAILSWKDRPIPTRLKRGMIAANMLTACAAGGAIAAAWLLTEPANPVFALCFLFAAAFDSALSNQQIYRLAMARQVFYIGLGAALSTIDGWLYIGFDSSFLSTHMAPVLAFGGFALAVTHASARSYLERLAFSKELERARDEAVRADESRKAFFAAISHEMRTPLHGILGMAQHLLSADIPEAQKAKIKVISDTGETLNVLLTDLLDIANVESDNLEITPANTSFHTALRHVVDLFRPVAEEKGLTLALEIDPETPDWLICDGARVRQCLGNLVSNAVKFTAQGRVEVRARRAAPHGDEGAMFIEVEVADTGPGIDAAARDRIFEPFAFAGRAELRRFQGAGLGLSIARRLAEKMDGAVTCQSVAGLGARFTFSFAARSGVPEAPRAGAAAAPAAGLATVGASVLIVDDVPTNRAIARLFLEPLAVEALEAADGEELEAVLRARDVDLVLLDLWMPGRSGEELMREIRAGAFGRADMPILALTADQTADRNRLVAAGFDEILLKPLDREQLQTTVRAALTRTRAPA